MNLPLSRKREVLDFILTEMTSHFDVVNLAEHARRTAASATAERHVDVLARGRE